MEKYRKNEAVNWKDHDFGRGECYNNSIYIWDFRDIGTNAATNTAKTILGREQYDVQYRNDKKEI